MESISKKSYDLLRDLDDEQDAIDSFMTDYDYDGSSSYLCDMISEIADNQVPIYTNDIWEKAKDIRTHIEEAIEEGLTEGVTDLERIFMIGYNQYYSKSLYNNLEVMIYNIIVEKINVFLNELTEEEKATIDLEAVESEIESKADDIDNNSRYDEIQDAVKEIIDGIKENEFDIEE